LLFLIILFEKYVFICLVPKNMLNFTLNTLNSVLLKLAPLVKRKLLTRSGEDWLSLSAFALFKPCKWGILPLWRHGSDAGGIDKGGGTNFTRHD